MSDFGERTRHRARGSAPPLNPLPDVSDEGVADHTRGRVRSPKILPMVAVSRCARGFTLVEIMVVVSIMAVILTMGIPPFVRAVHKEGMRKAESDLLEACQKARAGAIINAKPQDLIFRPLDGSFEAPGAFPNTLLPEGVSIESITLNDFERGEGDDNAVVVRFFPKGNSDDFRIVIRDNNNGSHCAVWLDPVTALADISTE